MAIIKNNVQGYGNDKYCTLLTRGDEAINTVPSPNEFSSVNHGGSEHTGSLYGTNIPVQDTSNYKFVSSWLFDVYASSSYIRFPASSDFQVRDENFTIDLYAYITETREETDVSITVVLWTVFSGSTNYHMLAIEEYGGSYTLWFEIREMNIQRVYLQTGFTSQVENWVHIAVVRDGTNYYLYGNGVLRDSDTYGSTLSAIAGQMQLGSHINSSIAIEYLNLENVRYSKGIARYKRNFTPPNRRY